MVPCEDDAESSSTYSTSSTMLLHTAPVTSLRHRSLMCVSEWEDESRAHNTTSRAPLKEGDYFTPGSWWAAPEIQATLSCPSIVLRSERSWRLRGGGMLNTPGAQCPAPHNPTHSAKCIHAHKLSISNWRSESFLRKYWKTHCLQLEPNKPVNRQTAYFVSLDFLKSGFHQFFNVWRSPLNPKMLQSKQQVLYVHLCTSLLQNKRNFTQFHRFSSYFQYGKSIFHNVSIRHNL